MEPADPTPTWFLISVALVLSFPVLGAATHLGIRVLRKGRSHHPQAPAVSSRPGNGDGAGNGEAGETQTLQFSSGEAACLLLWGLTLVASAALVWWMGNPLAVFLLYFAGEVPFCVPLSPLGRFLAVLLFAASGASVLTFILVRVDQSSWPGQMAFYLGFWIYGNFFIRLWGLSKREIEAEAKRARAAAG
jgi:hypothetical protein